jgi:hypothetical protein
VNRPFYAIGVLLAFLAVAMIAIGLSSHPTTQPASAQSGSRFELPSRRSPGSVVYLLVVPDAPSEAFAVATTDVVEDDAFENGAIEQPCYAAGCGLDRCTGQVYPAAIGPRIALHSTVVTLADEPALGGPARGDDDAAIDCRSHYDAQYDAAVYGETPYGNASQRTLAPLNSSYEQAIDDPTLILFRSLLGEQFDRRVGAVRRVKSVRRNWRYEAQAWGIGLANQFRRTSERLGLADEWERYGEIFGVMPATDQVATERLWSDYRQWIESQQASVAERDTPAGGASTFLSQPWRQVLQFAVSWLNHAAKTLGAAAERLGAGRSEAAAGMVGWQILDQQPR